MMRDKANIAVIIKQKVMAALSMTYLHLTLTNSTDQIKVTHISIENISLMVTVIAHNNTAIMLKHKYRLLLFVIFTFDLVPFSRSSQRHAHFGCEYLVNGGRWSNRYYCYHVDSQVPAFNCHI